MAPSSASVRCAPYGVLMVARTDEILIRVEGRVGRITLNRPERINALSMEMINDVRSALNSWAGDRQVAQILIDGAGERGLCAGGDIRLLYDGIRGEAIAPPAFWADEYRMNSELAHFGKPIVAYMEGITLGGGVGISGHCSIRIVTETSQVGMPETAIGLAPDVGGLFLLSRAPGELGTHAALTGARLGAADAISAGLADRFLPADRLPALTEQLRTHALTSPADIAGLADFREHPPPATMQFQRDWIDECYAGDDVSTILRRLLEHPAPSAQETGEHLSTMSPTSLKVTLAAVRRAASMTLDEVLAQDLRVCVSFLHHHDLAEGIRARLIERDGRPRWDPPRLEDVTDEQVQGYFARLDPADELWASRRLPVVAARADQDGAMPIRTARSGGQESH